MNKKRMWLLAISVATMVTATGIVMAATTADKQDNSTGNLQQNQSEKGDFAKRCGMKGFHEDKQALLDFLKIDMQTFKTYIKDGKTLAAIAQDQGISEQELTDFMVKQMSAHIDRDVKEGRLPDAQATQMRADIDQRVADMIHGKTPMHGFGPMRPAPFDHANLLDLLKLDDESFKTEMKAGKSLVTIAKEHNVSEQELTAFMTQQMTERINEDVKAGRIQENQAAQMKANMEKHVADIINGRAPMYGHGPMGHRLFHNEKLLSLLNMDEETLKTEVKSGKSLLTIAKEHNISEQELTALMTQQMTERIDEDVKAGRIQENQAAQMKTNMEKHVADIINGRAPMHGHGPMGHSMFHNEKLLSLLNMDEETLKTEMKSGKSLLSIAKEHGVSEQSLKDLMLEDMAQHLDQDVKEGRIPVDKATQIKANMENCVSDMINGKVPMKNHPQNDQQ